MRKDRKHKSAEIHRIVIDYEEDLSDVEQKFYSELKKDKISAATCKRCRKVILPPPTYCPYCSTRLKPSDFVSLPNSGKVLSQTIVHYPYPEDFPLSPPFSIIVLKIPKADTSFIINSKRLDIYLGDRIKILPKRQKEKKGDITDIDIEKF